MALLLLIIIHLLKCKAEGTVGDLDVQFKGCYLDNQNSPDLSGYSFIEAVPDPMFCCDLCLSKGFPYCALQRGMQCFCGNNYGRYGLSTDCKYPKCGPLICGGETSNSVYYSLSKTLSHKMYNLSFITRATDFDNARKTCLKEKGELASPVEKTIIVEMAQLAYSHEKIWIGLHRRHREDTFEWTEELFTDAYSTNEMAYNDYWKKGTDKSKECIVMIVSSLQWETVDCLSSTLPFVCKIYTDEVKYGHLPASETTGSPSNLTDSVSDDESQRIATMLYVVVPLFLSCYTGSCITYCAYRIIKNCGKSSLLQKIRREKGMKCEQNTNQNSVFIPVHSNFISEIHKSRDVPIEPDSLNSSMTHEKEKSINAILMRKMKEQRSIREKKLVQN